MNDAGATTRITLRIPGDWSHPQELVERLPDGVRLSPTGLSLPNGPEFEFTPLPPDREFPQIFQSACRRPPTEDELAILARYRVNVGMQVMGFPDLLMSSSDVDARAETIVEIIRYICGGDRPIDVGHMLADEQGPRFQVVAKVRDEFEAESSMHNPYGRLKIANFKKIAEGN